MAKKKKPSKASNRAARATGRAIRRQIVREGGSYDKKSNLRDKKGKITEY